MVNNRWGILSILWNFSKINMKINFLNKMKCNLWKMRYGKYIL